ncbi:MAG: molecular chaperone DnaK, partial [Pseudomonas fluorescens]
SAEALVHSTEKALKDHGDKVSADVKAKIEAELKATQELLSAQEVDKAALESQTEKLSEASMELGKAMYEAQAKAEADSSTSGQGNSDGSVDADYTRDGEEGASNKDDGKAA